MEKNFFAEVMLSQITSLLAFGGALLYALTQLSKVRLPAQLVAAGCAIVLVERVIWAYTYDSLMLTSCRKRAPQRVRSEDGEPRVPLLPALSLWHRAHHRGGVCGADSEAGADGCAVRRAAAVPARVSRQQRRRLPVTQNINWYDH